MTSYYDVGDLVLGQESTPQTHSSQRQIARQVGISILSVNRIIHKDLELKCVKKRKAHELMAAYQISRRTRSLQLLRHYPASMVNFIWFSDEKVFRVEAPATVKMTAFTCQLLPTSASFCEASLTHSANFYAIHDGVCCRVRFGKNQHSLC